MGKTVAPQGWQRFKAFRKWWGFLSSALPSRPPIKGFLSRCPRPEDQLCLNGAEISRLFRAGPEMVPGPLSLGYRRRYLLPKKLSSPFWSYKPPHWPPAHRAAMHWNSFLACPSSPRRPSGCSEATLAPSSTVQASSA